MALDMQIRYYMCCAGRNPVQLSCLVERPVLERASLQANKHSVVLSTQSLRPTNRNERAAVAAETLEVLRKGRYLLSGEEVDVAMAIQNAAEGTILYPATQAMNDHALKLCKSRRKEGFSIEVTNETTMQAGYRISLELGPDVQGAVCLLNFASAKNPGGGLLGGSLAQEESLATSSGLYACLEPHMCDFYILHRKNPQDGFYSHAMLYSPEVPFFRRDDSSFCSTWTAGVMTAPAPNAGVAARDHSEAEIFAVLEERIGRVLHLVAEHGHTHLVLGAYGCGVFKNNPDHVAAAFDTCLRGSRKIGMGVFERIVFAIPGGERDRNLLAFQERFDDHQAPATPEASNDKCRAEAFDIHKKDKLHAGHKRRKNAHRDKYADPNE